MSGHDPMEALRPKSVQELHATVAAAGRRKSLPPVVAQLQQLVEQRAACEERCVARLRDRASFEASLLPRASLEGRPGDALGELSSSEEQARGYVTAAVQKRFQTLESRCSVLCGRRLAHLVGGSPS
mmetsp:Transcript_48752/g.87824  ORF Transcript_48752/g.87824 Transcript_48752/m.87824 type:complete len:127 (+) Transcript_48752:67-447(+)